MSKGHNLFVLGLFLWIKQTKFFASWARLKASGGHIWPAGRVLCMSDLDLSKFHDPFNRKHDL